MQTFDYQFIVPAPVTAVRDFHHDPHILKKLSPPPIFVQVHDYEPLGEGSKAEFTLWFGPIPVRWTAVHHHVSGSGFTDRQLRGPLKFWEHTHRFTAVDTHTTRVREHIKFAHHQGWRGLLSRILFNKPGLTALFTARKLLTRHYVKKQNNAKALLDS
jgi:ligand-binding SRPBCC domain-containing protein